MNKWKVAAYVRLSSEDDNDKSNSIMNQIEIVDKYLENKNDMELIDYYIDNGFSGINLDRPQLNQMLREVKSKNIKKGIIVKDMSRLGRNIKDVLTIMNKISKRKVDLISTIEEENLKNNIMLCIIQWQREDELKRKKMGQRYFEERGALVQNPYKRGTLEDMEYKEQKREELKNKGIHHVTFKYKEDMKKKVGTRDERN